MIKTIKIQNFALIDEIEVEFDKSLNILTGETGAGKSIIIDAIDAAFGSRVAKEVIKTGQDKAYIEMTLETDASFNAVLLEDNGIEVNSNELIISREITQNATRSRINGVLVTQNFVQELRRELIDIHSQHETYNFLKPKSHIILLDNYGSAEHRELANAVKSRYYSLKKLKDEYDFAVSQNSEFEKKKDFLSFQINEIEEAQIEDVNEYETLNEKREIIINADELKKMTFSSYTSLYGEDNSIIDALISIEGLLNKAARYDKELQEKIEILTSNKISLQELARDLRDYSENLDIDEQNLKEIEDRIEILDKIKRKYGRTLQDVLQSYDSFSAELKSINITNSSIDEMAKEIENTELELKSNAENLTISRNELATELSGLIQSELVKLEMPKTVFSVHNNKQNSLNSNGYDDIEFFISVNAGEPLKSLAKVASGGEISRVMLALKSIFVKADNVNTVIFDEIDTGISGKTSQAVAEAMSKLSKHHQILCITHQPIIAAAADRYFYVEKLQTASTTEIRVNILNNELKIKALASLAGGQINEDTMSFSKNLIEKAESLKEQNTCKN